MKTLFVTASAQAEANYYLIAHLFKSELVDINRIVIISTEYSRKMKQVDNLRNLMYMPEFGLQDISVSELFLPNGIEETSVDEIKRLILEWISHHKCEEVIFNVTGGTKLISIAQDHLSAVSSDFRCVYQSRQKNQLVWYNSEGIQHEDLQLPESISAKLTARGYKFASRPTSLVNLPADQWYYITKLQDFMQQDFNKAQNLVFLLNALCSKAKYKEESSKKHDLSFPCTVKVDKKWLFSDCESWIEKLSSLEKPFFHYDKKGSKIIFDSKADLEFVHGQWFEVLTGVIVAQHQMKQKKESDIQIGLHFKQKSLGTGKNSNDGAELDVAYVDDGYFHLMECKTVNWNNVKGNPPITEMNHRLRKLDSVAKEIAGLNNHKYFVSLFEIPAKSQSLAKTLGIHLVTGKEVLNFIPK